MSGPDSPSRRRLTGPVPPNPYGAFAAVDGLGGTAASLLAGFSITLIALVLELSRAVRWPDLGLLLLALAAVLFLQVVQLNARARGYAVTPSQAREWYADLADPQRQAVVDAELRHHRECWSYLVRRTRFRYNLGILTLLSALLVVLIPRDQMTPWRVVAIGVVAAGIGMEGLEILDVALRRRRGHPVVRRLRQVLRWVVPTDPPLPMRFPAQPSPVPGDPTPEDEEASR